MPLRLPFLAVLLALCVWLAQQAIGVDFERLQQTAARRFGPQAAQAIHDWQLTLADLKSGNESEKLRQVNQFFNRRIVFEDDRRIWGQEDYWATPLETLSRGMGDCEDFSIAKYFSLKAVGVAPEKLRLTYVRARIGGPSSSITQAHMVLAYYATPDAEPLVLDNLIGEIRPASRRQDLTPIFSFNSEGLWVVGGPPEPASGGGSRLSRWRDLQARMLAEGHE